MVDSDMRIIRAVLALPCPEATNVRASNFTAREIDSGIVPIVLSQSGYYHRQTRENRGNYRLQRITDQSRPSLCAGCGVYTQSWVQICRLVDFSISLMAGYRA
jgi:hypothetical protein